MDLDTERDAADLAGELRNAVTAGELSAYYQPQYELETGRAVALEALVRWMHPEYGVLLPGRFIDVAEQYGLIGDIGHFMLEESGKTVADWHRRGLDVGLSINVSPSELGPEFAQTVIRRLHELELPHRTVTVEITESPAISYSRDELYALEALIDDGVGVSIDDFGTGHTSLELVKRLPITEVKIDKSLVHDPTRAIDDLVRECVDIARSRDAGVVAEGIETQEHYERARHWECDLAQGFFFSPPLPVDQVEELLLTAA